MPAIEEHTTRWDLRDLRTRQDPLVADNVIVNNTATEGGGMRFCYFWGGLPRPLVTRTVVMGNYARLHGGGVSCLEADPVFYHLTVDGNESIVGGSGIYARSGGHVTLINSIVANNVGVGLYAEDSGSITTDYCDVWNNSGGDYHGCVAAFTDISCEPEYCDESALDLHLYETSCCQGAGRYGVDIGALEVGCFSVPDVVFYDNFSDQNDDEWTVGAAGDASIEVVAGRYAASAGSLGSWCAQHGDRPGAIDGLCVPGGRSVRRFPRRPERVGQPVLPRDGSDEPLLRCGERSDGATEQSPGRAARGSQRVPVPLGAGRAGNLQSVRAGLRSQGCGVHR